MFALDGSLLTEAYVGGLMDRMVGVYERRGPSSVQLAASSDQMSSASTEIAQAIQGVASGASEQTASVNTANVASEGMQAALSSVSTSSTAAAEKSQDSMTAVVEGKQAAVETAEAMQGINDAVVATSTQIEELNESGEEIGAITETISQIADQTNLLALNAASEATRAGDMGRGFAVVADEVRSLAERSSSAAKDIAALIEKVQSGVGCSVTAMNAVVSDVDGGARRPVRPALCWSASCSRPTSSAPRLASIAERAPPRPTARPLILQPACRRWGSSPSRTRLRRSRSRPTPKR